MKCLSHEVQKKPGYAVDSDDTEYETTYGVLQNLQLKKTAERLTLWVSEVRPFASEIYGQGDCPAQACDSNERCRT